MASLPKSPPEGRGPTRGSYSSPVDDGSVAVGVTIDRQGSGSSFATNRASMQGSRPRRRGQDNKPSLLGALGLGSSFFRGNVKDELKKQVRRKSSVAGGQSSRGRAQVQLAWCRSAGVLWL